LTIGGIILVLPGLNLGEREMDPRDRPKAGRSCSQEDHETEEARPREDREDNKSDGDDETPSAKPATIDARESIGSHSCRGQGGLGRARKHGPGTGPSVLSPPSRVPGQIDPYRVAVTIGNPGARYHVAAPIARGPSSVPEAEMTLRHRRAEDLNKDVAAPTEEQIQGTSDRLARRLKERRWMISHGS